MDQVLPQFSWVVTLTLIAAVFFLSTTWKKIHGFLPPGPRQWPLIGNLPQIFGKDLHVALTDLSKKYGELVWMKLGSENVLVVNSMDATLDAFVKQGTKFAGRPSKRRSVEVMLGEGRDIVMNDGGPELKFHRKIVHSFLAAQRREGKYKLHNIMSREASSLVDSLETFGRNQTPFNPKMQISRVVANVLCQSVLNKRFETADEKFLNQLRIVQDIVDNIESFNIVDLIPWLEVLPIPSWMRFKRSLENKDKWVNDFINERRENLSDWDENDLLNIMLKLQKEAIEENDEEKMHMLSDKTIGHIVYELFGGGIESTTLSILWFLIYMIHNPECQDKAAAEVLQVAEEQGGIYAPDKAYYPYLDAAIKETLRLASVLPVGFPHRVTKDAKVGGYDVPKDTMVIMNIWSIHHDPNTWTDPFKFKPERFLEHGEKIYRRGYIPFGIGSRVCLGSTVAKMEVFMFCAYLLSRYRIEAADPNKLPELTGQAGLTMRPKPFEIVLRPRHIADNSIH